MANFIKTFFGFDFSKNSVNNVVKHTTEIKNAVISIGPVFQTLKDKVDKLSHVTFWVGISTSAEKAFGGVKSIVGSVAGDLKKIYGFADDYAKRGDKIAKTSRLVGLSVKDYQAFSSAAEDSGMAVEEMDSALKKFNINLAKARSGDKVMLANFSKALFGKDSDLNGLNNLKTNRDVLVALADSYSKVGKAEDKAFMSSELFGKSGLKMSEILSQGGKSVQSFLDSYDKGFTDDGAAKAEEFTHQLQMMREEFDGIKISVAQELFPVFRELFKDITGMLKGEDGSKLKSSLLDAGKSLTQFIKNILPRIPRILETIVKIVDALSPEVVASLGVVLSFAPAIAQIALGITGLWPLIKTVGGLFLKVGAIIKVIALGAVGAVVAKIGLVIAGAWSVYSIFTQIHQNWRVFSDYIEEKLQKATGVAYTLWGSLRVFVGHLEMAYRFIGLIFLDWKGWSEFITKDLANVNYFVNLIGDCLAGVMYGIYEVFNWVMGKFEKIGEYLGKFKSFFGLGDVNVNVNGSSSPQSTLAASAAQAISESHTTVTNRFAVDFTNVPRGAKITPPPKGDFDWSRGYMLGGV